MMLSREIQPLNIQALRLQQSSFKLTSVLVPG